MKAEPFLIGESLKSERLRLEAMILCLVCSNGSGNKIWQGLLDS